MMATGAGGLDEVSVQVVERGSHLGGVFLVHAEDDGLGETVGLFRKSVRCLAMASVRARKATRRSKSAVRYSSSGITRP